MNSVKYLQGTNVPKLTVVEEKEINNLCRETIQLFLSHQAENKHMWGNLPLLYTINIGDWVAVVKESPFQVLLFNHIIILVAAVP